MICRAHPADTSPNVGALESGRRQRDVDRGLRRLLTVHTAQALSLPVESIARYTNLTRDVPLLSVDL